MTNRRIVRYCILMALPVAALFALTAYFALVSVPRLVERDRRWVFDEARRVAEELRGNPSAATFVWEYGKGVVSGAGEWNARFPSRMTWKDWAPKGAKTKNKMWGWKDAGGSRVVWARDGRNVLAMTTSIAETDYVALFWLFAPLLLASITAAVAFAMCSLVAYAKSREDFLAATAHDMTTPLVAMRYLIGSDDDEAKTLNERMLRIVANIREFMKHGGRRRYGAAPFDLRAAYESAYSLFAADYRDAFDGDDVAVEEEGGAGAWRVVADELATVQIVWNILGNDLKYAAPYGRVKAKFSRDSRFVRLELVDEGPGMKPADRRRAFDRYWRAKTVLESGKGGFGIGLCVAREAARAMSGDLSLRPNRPHGCIFTLSLPAAD